MQFSDNQRLTLTPRKFLSSRPDTIQQSSATWFLGPSSGGGIPNSTEISLGVSLMTRWLPWLGGTGGLPIHGCADSSQAGWVLVRFWDAKITWNYQNDPNTLGGGHMTTESFGLQLKTFMLVEQWSASVSSVLMQGLPTITSKEKAGILYRPRS